MSGCGSGYFSGGRVTHVIVEGDTISATVEGSKHYDVQIEVDRQPAEWLIRAHCSCPAYVEYDSCCKHVWAVLRMVEKRYIASVGPPPATVGLEIADEELDGELEEFEIEPSPALFARPATGRDGPNRPAPPKPRPPAWEGLISTSPTGPSLRQATQRSTPLGEPGYVIDADRCVRHEGLTISLVQEANATAGRARPRQLTIVQADVARFSNPKDRVICGMLTGAARSVRDWSYGYRSYGYRSSGSEQSSAHWMVNSQSYGLLLPLLGETGRLFWRPSDATPLMPLKLDAGGAWELVVAITAMSGGRDGEVSAAIRRGGEFARLAPSDLLLDGDPGLILRDGTLASIRLNGCADWVEWLVRQKKLVVRPEELPRLLGVLGARGVPLPVVWPERWGIREVADLRPRGRVTLRSQQYSAAEAPPMEAELAFEYDKAVVDAADTRLYLEDRRGGGGGAIVRRDREAEQRLSDRLGELGLKPRARHGPPVIAAKRAPAAVIALLNEGWSVLGDKVKYRSAGDFSFNVSSGIDWFDLRGKMDFEGMGADVTEILAALKRGEQFVTLRDGSLGMLPENWLAKHGRWLRLGTTEGGRVRFARAQLALIDALLAEMPEATCDEQVGAARRRLAEFGGVAPRPEPEGFRGSLREYQREGLGWLRFLAEFGFGGCLADDMGLGKTVQLLGHVLDRRRDGEEGPWLVVAPKSLVFNWARESERFAPGLRVLDYTGLERKMRVEEVAKADLVLTTYGTLRRDVESLRETEFACVVLDEAQSIKNADSQAAKAARLLRAKRRLALTGTPVENRLEDLWSIFEFLNPGMLGGASAFRGAMVNGRGDDADLATLRRAMRPFILRRTKEKVAPELPALSEQTIVCDMGKKQQSLYDGLRQRFRSELLGRVDRDGLARSQIHVLEALLRLRQAACHTALIEAKPGGGESAKVETLLSMLEELTAEGHKALVFSQFTSLLSLVRRELDERKATYEYLDGKSPAKERAVSVDRFQTDPACRTFLVSLKAGGLGLNLTAADYVFLLDPWWNPAVESQAIDRTHRIGQDKRVFAYRLIARGTVEERILELQKSKRELAEAIVAEREGPLSALTRDELEWLLS